MTIKIAADVTVRTVRVYRTDGKDLKEHEALNKAIAYLKATAAEYYEFRDCKRQNYDSIDVRFEV